MRQGWTVTLGLLPLLYAGCVTDEPVRETSWLDGLRIFQGPTDQDVVQMDVAVVEQPLGDPYINEELWQTADERAVSLECKAMLEDNGFRIGLIGGIPPARLQSLLTSRESCPNPKQMQRQSGTAARAIIGPVLTNCPLPHTPDARCAEPTSLEKAEFTLVITPTLTRDGRTRLRFTPQIEYGDRGLTIGPTADKSGWTLEEQRQHVSFETLSWEITLSPNEYILIGGRTDRPGSFGHACFVRPSEQPPTQRLLVIRTSRNPPGLIDDHDPAEKENTLAVPPLALQASSASFPVVPDPARQGDRSRKRLPGK